SVLRRRRRDAVVDAVLDARLDHPVDERLGADPEARLVAVARHLREVEGAAEIEPVEDEEVDLAVGREVVAPARTADLPVVDEIQLAEVGELPQDRARVEAP